MFSEFLIVAISPLLPNLAVYTLNYCIPNWILSSSTKYSKKSVDDVLLIIFYICVRVIGFLLEKEKNEPQLFKSWDRRSTDVTTTNLLYVLLLLLD